MSQSNPINLKTCQKSTIKNKLKAKHQIIFCEIGIITAENQIKI